MDSKLNSELLKAAVDEDEKKEPPKPKRNSKDELVEKICQVATSSGIKLEYSETDDKTPAQPGTCGCHRTGHAGRDGPPGGCETGCIGFDHCAGRASHGS